MDQNSGMDYEVDNGIFMCSKRHATTLCSSFFYTFTCTLSDLRRVSFITNKAIANALVKVMDVTLRPH